jgi:ABC-type transport system involved in multi-copper enzyme maturation permease subunit
MNAAPVISRELKAEARNPLNYWFRLLGAAVVMAGFTIIMLNQRGSAAALGARLFRELNSMLFFSIAIFVPMLTADCLSREKREGTLGLLFLTPLTARDIVAGKSLIHTVRAFTLVLAALPILLLPFLLGGVTGRDVTHAISSNLGGLLLALAAGLLASTRNSEWVRAVVYAEILNGLFILLWTLCNTLLAGFILNIGGLLQNLPWIRTTPVAALVNGIFMGVTMRLALNAELLVAILLFLAVVRAAIRHLQRTWQEEIAAPPQPAWVSFFSKSDFWQSAFQWNKSKTLDRNPIAWLQEYSWTARLTKWGWFIAILISELAMLFNYRLFSIWQSRLALLLGLGIAFTSAWSFRRERQSGALELLLVTPLRARHLIGGRLWGLWAHFFPAVVLLLFLWLFNPFQISRYQTGMVFFFSCSFLTLPIVGLYFSLMRWHFLVAWLLTSTIGLLLPYFMAMLLSQYTRLYFGTGVVAYWLIGPLQFALAGYAFFRLHQNLSQRKFAVEHGTS